jgi:hypothetical protein
MKVILCYLYYWWYYILNITNTSALFPRQRAGYHLVLTNSISKKFSIIPQIVQLHIYMQLEIQKFHKLYIQTFL